MKNQISLLSLLAFCVWMGSCPAVAQQSTAFTYQGQLRDGGTNANGAYSMAFKLYDSASGGSQIGGTINANPTLANGLFTVNLDFGAGAFNGTARWLDITVQSGASSAETLAPRVQVLPTPYAQFAAVAATVTNGAIMNQQLAASAVATTNIQINAITTTLISNNAITNRNLSANAVNATNIAAGQVLKSLNGLTDFALLSPGTNVVITTNGNSLIIGAMQPSYAIFEDSATFVIATNISPGWRFMFEVWGGGGGGGGGGGSGNYGGNIGGNGGGGGGGGYGKQVMVLNPGDTVNVIVGAGGAGGGGGYSYGVGTNGATGATGGHGGTTSVTCHAITISATGGAGGMGGGGGGATGNQSPGGAGAGGAPGSGLANISLNGYQGLSNTIGGTAGNGGQGGNAGLSWGGEVPGGGGAGAAPASIGASGAHGRVVMWW